MSLADVLNKKNPIKVNLLGESPEYKRAIQYVENLAHSGTPVARDNFKNNIKTLFPNLSALEIGRLSIKVFGIP